MDIRDIQVEKLPTKLHFQGRVLYLVDDADLIRRQIAGEDLALTDELRSKLRDQISTDEITPASVTFAE